MKKYKVIQPIYKILEDKYYNVGDTIELNIPEGEQLVRQGMLAHIEKAKTQPQERPSFPEDKTTKTKK